MDDLSAIRALVVALGYTNDPASVEVRHSRYRGPGDRSDRKGWCSAAAWCNRGHVASYGYGATRNHLAGAGGTTIAATSDLRRMLALRAEEVCSGSGRLALSAREDASALKRRASEAEARASQHEAKAASLRAVLAEVSQ